MRLDLRARIGEQRDNGNRPEDLDQRGCQRLLPHIPQVALEQSLGGLPEAPRFVLLGAEGLYYLVAAERLLQNLVQVGGMILAAAAGAANAAADPRRRNQHEWQYGKAHQ